MKELKRMANLTMHDQSQYKNSFEELGFKIEVEPRLKTVSSTSESLELAEKIRRDLIAEGIDSALLGGKTDLSIYLAIELASRDVQLYTVNTERVRDENDRFVFQFKGLDKLCVRKDNEYKGTVCLTSLVDDEQSFTQKFEDKIKESKRKFSQAAIRELYKYYNSLPQVCVQTCDPDEWTEINAGELRALAGYGDIGHMTDPQEECRPDFEIIRVRQPGREKPDANNPWHRYETDTYLVSLEKEQADKYAGGVFDR